MQAPPFLANIDYELENFVKYLNYAARVAKRYVVQKRLGD